MIATEAGILKPEWVEELSLVEVNSSLRFSDPVVALRVSMGLAWEDFYIREHLSEVGVIDHPGEYEVDGIYMSPDGEELATVIVDRRPHHRMKVHEVKCTWKSTNTVGETEGELLTQFMWMCQVKGYCKAMNTTLADLHVCFVNGGYRPPAPEAKIFHLEFDQSEIDDNWDMLVNYRDSKLRQGY